MAPPRKSKNQEALMAFAPVKRRHPPREEIERGNVRYSMLNMMATGNPLVPKFAPWGSSRKASSSEPIIEVIDMRSQRDKTIKRLTETWAESTGDPTLPDMMVERLKVLQVGQDHEFTVTQDGKKSHSVKMTRRFENGEDLVQILVSMNRGDVASSDTQTKPEKAKKETKGSSGKSSAAASSDKEDEADAGESTAPAEVEDAKQKGQGKKAKGKGKAAAPEADPEAAPEAAPEASAAAPAAPVASGAHGEWTQAQDESILSLKGANETWVNIAKQVGRGKNEVQKRYKELSAAKNEPPKEEPATNSNGNAKPSPAKSPNKPQDGTNRSPGGPAPGFPPPALSGNPHVMDARHPAYFGYPPPADVYHSGYAPFPHGGYHYLPPRPEYYHPHYPPGPFNPYYPPAIVNNNNYYPMHGPGAYMGTRSDNHFPTEEAHDWLLSEGAAVKYMNKGGKRIVLIRCYSGDRIRINNHLLEEPPNGWRNDKHSSSRPLRYEMTSIHARVRAGSSVWVMGSEVDAPGSGWGNESEGCKIYTHREGGSQGSITSPKGSGFGSNSNNGENQNSGSPVAGAEQANNGSQNGEVAANTWDNNANTSVQEWDNNANTTAEEPAWNNSGNDNTQNTFDAENNNEVPTTEWDNTNNDNAGGFADLGTATEQMNLENITAGFNSIVDDADNNNASGRVPPQSRDSRSQHTQRIRANSKSVSFDLGHPGSPAKNSDTAAPADDWPSNLPRSFMDAFTIDLSKGSPEDLLLLSPNTRARAGLNQSSTKGKGKQPSTGKGGGKNGGSKIASDTGTHVPGEWTSSPNFEAENEGGNNDAGATSWGDDNNATAGASNWDTGNTTAGASTWDDGNGASGAQASTW
ncbi:hypothetical protein V8F33_003303 [Rhypophila sp. PSN 637]